MSKKFEVGSVQKEFQKKEPTKLSEGRSIITNLEEDISLLRREEESTGQRKISSLRKEIAGRPDLEADKIINQADKVMSSGKIDEAKLQELKSNLQTSLTSLEDVQSSLHNKPSTPGNRREMDFYYNLIDRLQNRIDALNAEPEDIFDQYEKISFNEASEQNKKQLLNRQVDLKAKLKVLEKEIDALTNTIEKKGIYGKGVSAQELVIPTGGFFKSAFSSLKIGMMDLWRKAKGQESVLGQLREKIQKQQMILDEIEPTITNETDAQAKIRVRETKNRETQETKKREQRTAAKARYGDASIKSEKEFTEEFLGDEFNETPTIETKRDQSQDFLKAEGSRKKIILKTPSKEEIAAKLSKDKARNFREKVKAPTKEQVMNKFAEDEEAKKMNQEILDALETQNKLAQDEEKRKREEEENQLRPPEKSLKDYDLYEKIRKPMDIESAKLLVPHADRLWDLANKQIEKYPVAHYGLANLKQFGVTEIENHPATIFVYAIAKYKQAIQDMDKELAENHLNTVNTLIKDLHLTNNALVQSIMAKKSNVKDVLKGVKQRRASVIAQNRRWKA